MCYVIMLLLSAVVSSWADPARGNVTILSFETAKKVLARTVYADHRIDFYCKAAFDENKNVILPDGFITPSYEKRATRIEWEHIVPAENFGRFFTEWREGDNQCVDSKGKAYKGRKCAKKNQLFAVMEADLWNLVPAIGAVNAVRSNYKFTVLPKEVPSTFGVCPVKVNNHRVEPPEYTRGTIARATLYMAWAYPEIPFLSDQQRKLMEAWDRMYPPSKWECERGRRIMELQGNVNPYTANACNF